MSRPLTARLSLLAACLLPALAAAQGNGQPNSAAATLLVNGMGGGAAGPFEVPVVTNAPGGSQLVLDWSGPPNQPYALLFSPQLSVGSLVLGCEGQLDLALPGSGIALNGLAVMLFSTNGAGTSRVSVTVPNLPPGPLLALQGAVFQPPGVCPSNFVLTAAFDLTAQLERSIVESFQSDAQLDRDASSGTWAAGLATFGQIGGDGVHGPFRVDRIATDVTPMGSTEQVWQIDTDNTTIPGDLTASNQPITVTDGQFFFSEMVVEANQRLVFVGTSPPRFSVRGRLQIDGAVEVDGESVEYFESPVSGVPDGQPGGAGGVFGGAGGAGGERCLGNGALPEHNGDDGDDCQVLAGHAFAGQTAGTGGRGSTLFPGSGLNTTIQAGFPPLPVTVSYCMQAAAGGGGGGLVTPGAPGQAVTNPVPDPGTGVPPRASFLGPPAAGGIALPALLPIPAMTPTSLHLLVGGSGGGGGGSQAAFNINLALSVWAPGSGGGGGGGALALRAGDVLEVAGSASVSARGGSAGTSPNTPVTLAKASPGGGGSGGSIVLQAGRTANVQGAVDVRGGDGGRLARSSPPVVDPRAGGFLQTDGGAGSPGVARLELPVAPPPTALPGLMPPAGPQNTGPLLEQDDRTGFQSAFYSTGQASGPTYVRYEITALVAGVPTLFSDDPQVGVPAQPGSAPITASFQAGTIDLTTGQVNEQTIGPWRAQVGGFGGAPSLDDDGLNAFRFAVVLDRTLGLNVTLLDVRVVFRI